MPITRRTFLKTVLAGSAVAVTGVKTRRVHAQAQPTPYDSKVGIWHWNSEIIGERTLLQVGDTLRQQAPSVQMLLVKTHDGANWMTTYDDSGSELAINGIEAIQRWVGDLESLSAFGLDLDFHTWCVVKGTDARAEASRVLEVASVPGVQSVILDVEGGPVMFEGDEAFVEAYIGRIRDGLSRDVHIGLATDARPGHLPTIHFEDWLPYIDSVHPFAYWDFLDISPQQIIDTVYETLAPYDVPVYPLFMPGPTEEMREAVTYASEQYRAGSVSWFRFGLFDESQIAVVEDTVSVIQRPFG